MVKGMLKRALSLFLTLFLVIGFLPAATVSAATETVGGMLADPFIGLSSTGDGSGSWTAGGTEIKGEVTGSNKTSCAPAKSAETTLTITNSKSVKASIFFSYTTVVNGGSVEIDGTTAAAQGFFKKEMDAGDSVKVTLRSAEGQKTTSIVLNGINLLAADVKPSISFLPSSNGSYTVDGNVVEESGQTGEKNAVDGYVLKAGKPAEGFRFFGWYRDGTLLSEETEIKFYSDSECSVGAKFIPADAPVLDVGNTVYFDWNEAIRAAQSGSNEIDKIVSVRQNSVMDGDYTIPAGVTLLVPFDDKNTCYKEEPESILTAGTRRAYSILTVRGKLTVASGGVVSVSAKHCSQQGYIGTTGPSYGQIVLDGENSAVLLQEGAALYAYGYITGSGTVTAYPGSEVWEYFRVMNWRGGSASLSMKGNEQKVFPFSQYYVQNIEAKLRIYEGASEKISTTITAAGMDNSVSTGFIGENSLFEPQSEGCYIEKWYDGATDRLHLAIYGDMQIGAIDVYGLSSGDYVLPINSNISVDIKQGTFCVTEDISLLPGVKVTVDPGASLKIAEGKAMFAYDREDWVGKHYAYQTTDFQPDSTPLTKGYDRRTTDLTDVRLDINGTLIAEGGFYTTAGQAMQENAAAESAGSAAEIRTEMTAFGGAEIVSSEGTGVIKIIHASDTARELYEVTQSGTKITYHPVPVTPATLKNADGSYTLTSGTAGRQLSFHDGSWILQEDPVIEDETQTDIYDKQPKAFLPNIAGTNVAYRTSGSDETWSAETPVCAGTYDVHLSRKADALYTEIDRELPAALVIQPKPVTVSWSEDGFIYDESEKQVLPSLIGVVEGDEVTADQISGDRQTDAGSYTAKVGGLAGKDSGNYVLEESVYCWSIAPAEGAPEIRFPSVEGPVTYAPGQTLEQLTLTGGSTQYGIFQWVKSDIVPQAGKHIYEMKFIPSDRTKANYLGIVEMTAEVTVDAAKGDQGKPELSVTNPSFSGGRGTIAGLTTQMEWSENGTDWIPVTAEDISADRTFEAGFHRWVRFAATDNLNPGEAVEIRIEAYSSGSSGGSVRYNISVDNIAEESRNGIVTLSVQKARKGDRVTVTVKPDEGYQLDGLTAADRGGHAVLLTDRGDGIFTFIMPASEVKVKATFKENKSPVLEQPFTDVSENDYFFNAVQWAVDRGITAGMAAGTFAPDISCTRAQMVTFLWRAAGSPAAVSEISPFADVPEDAYYYDAVSWAAEQGITGGTGAGNFSPDTVVTRGQTVTFLYRAAGSPVVSGNRVFADVSEDAYYAGAVAWAVDEGITNGVGDNVFRPETNCTRAQIVTFLYREAN